MRPGAKLLVCPMSASMPLCVCGESPSTDKRRTKGNHHAVISWKRFLFSRNCLPGKGSVPAILLRLKRELSRCCCSRSDATFFTLFFVPSSASECWRRTKKSKRAWSAVLVQIWLLSSGWSKWRENTLKQLCSLLCRFSDIDFTFPETLSLIYFTNELLLLATSNAKILLDAVRGWVRARRMCLLRQFCSSCHNKKRSLDAAGAFFCCLTSRALARCMIVCVMSERDKTPPWQWHYLNVLMFLIKNK